MFDSALQKCDFDINLPIIYKVINVAILLQIYAWIIACENTCICDYGIGFVNIAIATIILASVF